MKKNEQEVVKTIDTEYSIQDTMSYLNTNDNQEETICTLDLNEGISIDIQYLDTGKKTSLKIFIFKADGTGDYVPMEGNFYSIQECIDYINSIETEDLKEEL